MNGISNQAKTGLHSALNMRLDKDLTHLQYSNCHIIVVDEKHNLLLWPWEQLCKLENQDIYSHS